MLKIYALDEFAALEGMHRPYLWRLLARGDGPEVVWIGRRRFITEEQRQEWHARMARERTAEAKAATGEKKPGHQWTEQQRQAQRERRLAFLQANRRIEPEDATAA